MSIPEFSVRRRVTVLMIILIVTLFGVIAFFNIGQDLLPDLEYPVLSVLTRYEGVSSREIEKLVTKPMEEVLSTLKDIKRVTSTSREGFSVIVLEFNWGTNVDLAAEDARSQINVIKEWLPADASDPLVLKFDTTMMPVIMMAVTGMENGYALRKYLVDVVTPKIEQLDGVAMVFAIGGETREIQIEVDKEALDSFGLTLSQVVQAVGMENMDQSGGELRVGVGESRLKVSGEYAAPEEIESIVLTIRGARTVTVADVARVHPMNFKEARARVRANRKPAAFFAVMKQSGANTTITSNLVKNRLEEMKPTMPPDIVFHNMMDFGDLISRITAKTRDNFLTGALLAVIFVYLFLRNWRPTLAIFFAIPLSVLTAFIGMYVMDYTFNLMTLGGLALGVGMLVDNAIVVVENTYRHLQLGEERIHSAITGAGEVDTAIVASTLTTVSVFVPMVLVGGVASQLARPLALTVCLALVSSLFVAVTLVPAIAATLFRMKTKKELETERARRGLFERANERYREILDFLLDRGWAVAPVVIVIVAAAAFVGINYLGGEFLPVSDRPFLFVQVELPVGSTLDDTDRIVSVVENYALEHKQELGIQTVMINAGVFEDDPYAAAQQGNPLDVNEASIMARLEYQEDRELRSYQVQDRLRQVTPNLEPVPGAKMSYIDPMSQMTTTSQESAPIVVKLMGNNLEYLREVAEKTRKRIRALEGIADVTVTVKEGKPERILRIDRERAAQFGLSTPLVAAELRAALKGTIASRYREKGDEFDVRVRLEEQDRNSLEKLLDLSIMTPSGTALPIRQIATITEEKGPQQIHRENRRRKVSLLVSPRGMDLVTAVGKINEAVADLNDELVEHGTVLEYGGEYQDRQETVDAMIWAGIAAIILVYMVMAAQFESLYQPLVVMITVPLGLVGVVLGLAITGRTISLPAMLGFVILVGIVVNNAIVMIDYVNLLRRRDGIEKRRAIIEGAGTRLRPVLITSLTTIVGMLPMAISQSQGSEMRSPLAIAVASGLAFSMVLTLFVIPVAYNYFDSWAQRLVAFLSSLLYGETENNNQTDAAPSDGPAGR